MKKNFSVNIGGRIFNIDDDAFECLNSYLSRLRSFFAADQGYDEIISDIEMRIAELLDQRKEPGQQIITLKHIQDVITSMGEPDQLSDTENEKPASGPAIKTRGKLYRDPDNRQVGGVAAGIAAWFGIDPVWVRLIFAGLTLFYAVGIILYAILWLILPVAQTTSEKLEMQRQMININTLRNELATAGTGIQKTGNKVLRSFGMLIRFGTEVVSRVFTWFFRLLGRLAGLAMLLAVIGIFVGISTASLIREYMSMGDYRLDTTTLIQALQWLIPGPDVRWLAYITVLLILVAITGLLVYFGLRLLLKWPPLRWQVVILFVLMLVAGIMAGAGTAFQYSKSSEEVVSITKRHSFPMKKNRIQLVSGPNDYRLYFMPLAGDTIPGNETYVLGEISLSIRPVPADSLFVTQIPSAASWHESQAAKFSQNISHAFKLVGNTLTINRYFMFPHSDGMRYQNLDLIVGIPIDTEVEIDDILRWHTNNNDFTEWNNNGNIFTMTTSGLQLKQIPEPVSDTIQKAN